MRAPLQFGGILLCLLFSSVLSQTEERVWLSTTTPAPSTYPSSSSTTSGIKQVPENINDELSQENTEPVLPSQGVVDSKSSRESSEQIVADSSKLEPVVLNDDLEQIDVVSSELKPDILIGNVDTKQAVSSEQTLDNNNKPRKWMSTPLKEKPLSDTEETIEHVSTGSPEELSLEEISVETLEEMNGTSSSEMNATSSLYEPDGELPPTEEILDIFEDDMPMFIETIISKKTTIYVTFGEAMADPEPLYVNLTGIRGFTGTERIMVPGCLDLSDLYITGEEAKEVIQRMAKQKFHRLDLSNNHIEEFPTNTFSPVAFTVRELKLNGNPLLSNLHDAGSMLQRGGLFHLTELRELNLSSCALQDIDFFTPWNSNHLEVVDLSCNKLHSVPANLQFFHKLKKLYLSGNPIKAITELPFALLWNLQVLSLSSCLVSSITSDPFRNMEHLKELSLEGNNLTRINELRLSRSCAGVKLYLSGNPWHCACEMLMFIDHYHYAVRDLEDLRCATPRWLEGLRTAYLTKEILSLDSMDGDCLPPRFEVAAPVVHHFKPAMTDRLEILALAIFVLAALFMIIHVICGKKKDKYKFDDERSDINYIRIEKKPNVK